MREHCIKIRAKAHQAVPFQARSATCRTLRRQDALQDESRQAKLSGSQTVYFQKVCLVLNATPSGEMPVAGSDSRRNARPHDPPASGMGETLRICGEQKQLIPSPCTSWLHIGNLRRENCSALNSHFYPSSIINASFCSISVNYQRLSLCGRSRAQPKSGASADALSATCGRRRTCRQESPGGAVR